MWKCLQGRGEGGGLGKLGGRSWEKGVGKLGNSGEAKALPSLQIVTTCNACYVSIAASYVHYIIHYSAFALH